MSFIERALQLAGTGKYRTLTDLDHALQAEGFTLEELEEMRGAATKKKLREVMMAAAKPAH